MDEQRLRLQEVNASDLKELSCLWEERLFKLDEFHKGEVQLVFCQ